MLRALLHGKLQERASPDADGEGEEDDGAPGHAEVARREDPLTAAVFSRLTYLPIERTWELLLLAVRPASVTPWPAVPSGDPSWSFWPGWSPGAGGRNRRKVEPDVVLHIGRDVFLFEAKHRGLQSDDQWSEQVLAAQARQASGTVTMVAVGGWTTPEEAARARRFTEGFPGVPLFLLPWEDLRKAASDLRFRTAAAHEREVLHDIERAVLHWGYRPRVGFDTLATFARGFGHSTTTVLRPWSLRGAPLAGRTPRSAGFRALVDAARSWRPLASAPTLSTWRPT